MAKVKGSNKLKAMMMGENVKDMAKDKKMGIKENKVESKEKAGKKPNPFAKKKK